MDILVFKPQKIWLLAQKHQKPPLHSFQTYPQKNGFGPKTAKKKTLKTGSPLLPSIPKHYTPNGSPKKTPPLPSPTEVAKDPESFPATYTASPRLSESAIRPSTWQYWSVSDCQERSVARLGGWEVRQAFEGWRLWSKLFYDDLCLCRFKEERLAKRLGRFFWDKKLLKNIWGC